MNVQVSWHNIPASPFMEPLLSREVDRLERRFAMNQGMMGVRFRQEGERYRARVHVQAMGRDWWVTGEGANLAEGLVAAFDHLERKLAEFKRFTRDKIHKRFRKFQLE